MRERGIMISSSMLAHAPSGLAMIGGISQTLFVPHLQSIVL
jgi:hypothetical protein